MEKNQSSSDVEIVSSVLGNFNMFLILMKTYV